MNAAWHRENVLGRKATLDERIAWHRQHRRVCACRPPPASLAAYLAPAKGSAKPAALADKKPAKRAAPSKAASSRRGTAGPKTPAERAAVKREADEPRGSAASAERSFAQVVEVLGAEPGVTYGGKGFGSRGLKLDGKLFAMLDTRGELVVKLPRDRVSQLIAAGKGAAFETGGGRVMKEWVALSGAASGRASASGDATAWTSLVREALRFVRGA